MYIKRALEDILLWDDKTFKAVLLTGARQTGKSTVLNTLFADRKSITFDDAYLEEQAKQKKDSPDNESAIKPCPFQKKRQTCPPAETDFAAPVPSVDGPHLRDILK